MMEAAMILLMLGSLVLSLIYLPSKVVDDIKAKRVGWAVVGSVASLNIVAQVLFGLTLFLGLGKV